ncbi:MAG: rhodanese-related sulfurtransferase [Elainellaceae cyanobacterium]
MTALIATFYKFVPLPNYAERQGELLALCDRHNVKGTILLAEEGINGTIAGAKDAVHAVLAHLRSDPRLKDLQHREALSTTTPFERMKVRLKAELVPLGVDGIDPAQEAGTYVAPEQWNELIQDPEVLLIDTRNDYEVAIGTFQGAVNPDLQAFREFPDYVERHLDSAQHRKVAMFCTGGIRCEKTTAYLRQQGFDQVYHLEGGILEYLKTVPPEKSLWNGECFVFDQRVAVTHGLEAGTHVLCYACGNPVSPEDQASPQYEPTVSCPHCYHRHRPRL